MDERDKQKEGDNMQALKKLKATSKTKDTSTIAKDEDVISAIVRFNKKHAKLMKALAK